MNTYLVIGRIPGDDNLMKNFNTFEDALQFVYRNDALGFCWVRCPDGRWFHPNTMTWRVT